MKKSNLIIIAVAGVGVIALGFYFSFGLFIQSIWSGDIASFNFSYLIIGSILIGIGMFMTMRPLQLYMIRYGTNKSFEMINQAMGNLAKNQQTLKCPTCRKPIPQDANLCPYCGERINRP
jgi:hypothetical protein